MIQINKMLDIDETTLDSLMQLPFNVWESLIFDIETTGFSALTSQLYLIGIAYIQGSQWHLIQWIAQTKSDEKLLLDCFFSFAHHYKRLVHFNGDNFDIPYLLKKCEILKYEADFQQLESFDLYKYFKKFKSYLPLERFSLKEIEKYLNIIRRDPYSGGELIQNYYNYVNTGDNTDFAKLLLHNEDDLIGTIQLLPASLLGVILQKQSLEVTNVESYKEEALFIITLNTAFAIPCSIQYTESYLSLEGHKDTTIITITINGIKGILKHFFPNYKEYYYLPLEDTAIHKSVAQFVDSDHKKKATKTTCYIKKASLYLPQNKILYEPVFYKEYNDKISYFEWNQEYLGSDWEVLEYVAQLLNLS